MHTYLRQNIINKIVIWKKSIVLSERKATVGNFVLLLAYITSIDT